MSSSVLFERTLAMRQGIHSLADFRVSAGRFHSHENRDFDSCGAKNAYPPTDDFTGVSDMGALHEGLPLGRMKPPCG